MCRAATVREAAERLDARVGHQRRPISAIMAHEMQLRCLRPHLRLADAALANASARIAVRGADTGHPDLTAPNLPALLQ